MRNSKLADFDLMTIKPQVQYGVLLGYVSDHPLYLFALISDFQNPL